VEADRGLRRRGSHNILIIGSQMAVRLSALRADRPLLPRIIPGTHFCQRLSRPQGHRAVGRIKSIEKSKDLRYVFNSRTILRIFYFMLLQTNIRIHTSLYL
jgi:hypothetical protein